MWGFLLISLKFTVYLGRNALCISRGHFFSVCYSSNPVFFCQLFSPPPHPPTPTEYHFCWVLSSLAFLYLIISPSLLILSSNITMLSFHSVRHFLNFYNCLFFVCVCLVLIRTASFRCQLTAVLLLFVLIHFSCVLVLKPHAANIFPFSSLF